MHIEVQRVNSATHFVATSEEGVQIHLDGSPAIGGQGLGMRPMELVLTGLAGCSAMDVVAMLDKKGHRIDSFKIIADAERAERKVPAVFTTIHLHFVLSGAIPLEVAKEAVELSMTRFCSVSAMLRPGVSISYDTTVEA